MIFSKFGCCKKKQVKKNVKNEVSQKKKYNILMQFLYWFIVLLIRHIIWLDLIMMFTTLPHQG